MRVNSTNRPTGRQACPTVSTCVTPLVHLYAHMHTCAHARARTCTCTCTCTQAATTWGYTAGEGGLGGKGPYISVPYVRYVWLWAGNGNRKKEWLEVQFKCCLSEIRSNAMLCFGCRGYGDPSTGPMNDPKNIYQRIGPDANLGQTTNKHAPSGEWGEGASRAALPPTLEPSWDPFWLRLGLSRPILPPVWGSPSKSLILGSQPQRL